jgi:hypothetical protein
MVSNKDALRKALEVLSHVTSEDFEGMEPEFFAAVTKLSHDYEKNVRMNIVKNNLGDYIRENMPPCPSCLAASSVVISSPSIELRYYDPYVDVKEECVMFYTDIDEVIFPKNYESEQNLNLTKAIDLHVPGLRYLLNDHAYCKDCNYSFPANDFIKTICNKNTSFNDIVKWKNEKANRLEK